MKIYSKPYTFKKSDNGIIGKAFEMSIKNALHCKNPDTVSRQGKPDFQKFGRCYDVKQNGTIIKHELDTHYIPGSSRVIYAVHCEYITVAEDADTITIAIDLMNTEAYTVDRNEFVRFLLDNGHAKENKSRNTINIQTLYNYKKDEYHGKRGHAIAEWCRVHELEDEVLPAVWDSMQE
jgi:hypothetical protein